MEDQWRRMTLEDGRAMDERKERGPGRLRTAVNREVLWRIIKSVLPEDRAAPVLDLGGGTGVWALRIAAEGYSVVLTDVSPGLLARASEKIEAAGLGGRVSIEEADICDLSRYEDASFPLALALGDVLSYCDDADRALQEVWRVTQPDGVFIGDVENRYRAMLSGRRGDTWADAKRVLLEGVAHWPDAENARPIREYTPTELRELLTANGWSVVHMYPSLAVAAALGDRALQEAIESEGGLEEVVVLEERLRQDKSLLGSGPDIQYVARKSPA